MLASMAECEEFSPKGKINFQLFTINYSLFTINYKLKK